MKVKVKMKVAKLLLSVGLVAIGMVILLFIGYGITFISTLLSKVVNLEVGTLNIIASAFIWVIYLYTNSTFIIKGKSEKKDDKKEGKNE